MPIYRLTWNLEWIETLNKLERLLELKITNCSRMLLLQILKNQKQ
jgi:hypothetical protein